MDLIQIMECPDGLLLLAKFLRKGVLPLFQIGIPIILIVMGTVDLGKAVLSSDDKEIKAGTGRLIKRAIAAVAVFFVSTIVSLLMGLFSTSGTAKNDNQGEGLNKDGGAGIEGTASWSDCWEAAK